MLSDFIFQSAILNEIKTNVLNAKIDKIFMPDKNVLLLGLNTDHKHFNLLISPDHQNPRIHFTDYKYENPINSFQFCQQIRKLFNNGILIDIKLLNNDRIFELTIDGSDELRIKKRYYLILEIMSRASNLFLLNEEYKIINSIYPVSYDNSSKKRQLFIGSKYVFFDKNHSIIANDYIKSKKDFFEFNNDDIKLRKEIILNKVVIKDNDNDINLAEYNYFNGLSKKSFNELIYMIDNNFSLNEIINQFTTFKPHVELDENNNIVDILYNKFYSLENNKQIEIYSISKETDRYFNDYFNKKIIKNKASSLFSTLNSKIKKLNKNIENNIKQIEVANKNLSIKDDADLLKSNMYLIKNIKNKIVLFDYNKNIEKEFILDNKLNLSQNIQAMYNKYKKYQRQIDKLSQINAESKELLNYLINIQKDIENLSSIKEIDDIRQILINENLIKDTNVNTKNKKKKEYIPQINKTIIDGYTVYIGSNAYKNDYISFKIANHFDIWMHAKYYHGPHIIISLENNKKINDEIILKAAKESLKYSSFNNEKNITFDYCEKKYVKRHPGRKIGQVIYSNFKSITI